MIQYPHSISKHLSRSLAFYSLATRFVRVALAGSLGGNPSAIFNAASDSACSSVFAEVNRSLAYQFAREETELLPPLSSSNLIDSNFFEADCRRKSLANWRLPPAHNTNRAIRRSASRSPLGPSSMRMRQPLFRNFLPSGVMLWFVRPREPGFPGRTNPASNNLWSAGIVAPGES